MNARAHPFARRELLYPANLLSLLRLGLVPVVMAYVLREGRERAALAAVAGSMLTDMIDGPIARSRGEVSQLGMLLDPLADKLTIDGVALALTLRGRFPLWATVLLLGRDTVILGGALMVYQRQTTVTPPNMSGKLATVAFTASLLAYMLGGPRVGRVVLGLSLLPYVASSVSYGRALARYLSGREES